MSAKYYYSVETVSGIKICVVTSKKGITNLILKFKSMPEEFKGATKLQPNDPYLFNIFAQLKEYFAGTRKIFDVPLDVEGTDFQEKVWVELKKIPYGKTRSYKEIAKKLGDVNKIRAVGKANGQNPVAIVIPCHRVIGADGKLTGYAGGLDIKEKLLHLEGALNPELFD
jgi:methylated-DNA-[protein]-cysteine S-methyltransferase